MHVLDDAQLRHRELTQEVYDIGDEVAEYIEHLAQAVTDWDVELVWDCADEFNQIMGEAITDSRLTVGELIGLRHALVAGVCRGRISLPHKVDPLTLVPMPEKMTTASLTAAYPLQSSPMSVKELSEALQGRTDDVAAYLRDVADWVISETSVAAADLQALDLPRLFRTARTLVEGAVTGWQETVAAPHPGYCRTMRGHHPPQFLIERARVDMVVARIKAKRAKAKNGHTTFAS